MKHIQVLTAGGRTEENIIFIDNTMSNFTNKLTNGIFVPAFLLSEQDFILKSLQQYLINLYELKDARQQIKTDFNLLNKFNNSKQNQAFFKIQSQSNKIM